MRHDHLQAEEIKASLKDICLWCLSIVVAASCVTENVVCMFVCVLLDEELRPQLN